MNGGVCPATWDGRCKAWATPFALSHGCRLDVDHDGDHRCACGRRYIQRRGLTRSWMKRSRPPSMSTVNREARQAALLRDGGCIARGIGDVPCAGRIEAHHLSPKQLGGRKRDDVPDDLASLCAAHHAWTHGHPIEARAAGLLR